MNGTKQKATKLTATSILHKAGQNSLTVTVTQEARLLGLKEGDPVKITIERVE